MAASALAQSNRQLELRGPSPPRAQVGTEPLVDTSPHPSPLSSTSSLRSLCYLLGNRWALHFTGQGTQHHHHLGSFWKANAWASAQSYRIRMQVLQQERAQGYPGRPVTTQMAGSPVHASARPPPLSQFLTQYVLDEAWELLRVKTTGRC